jgi:hypothetical protein
MKVSLLKNIELVKFSKAPSFILSQVINKKSPCLSLVKGYFAIEGE